MATTGFWPVKNHLREVLAYADNPEKTTGPNGLDRDLLQTLHYAADEQKTDEAVYVSAINCPKQMVYESMIATKRRYGKTGGNVAYHGYMSFREGEVNEEQALAIGMETARRMWGDKYEVLVAVHRNTENLHCHFVINSVSFKTGEKFKNKIRDHKRLREIADEVCRENQLSVLENAPFYGGEKGAYWLHKDGKLTRRDMVKANAERALSVSVKYADFFMNLRRLGYEVDERRLSVRAPDWERNIRLSSVGITQEFIEQEFHRHLSSMEWYAYYRVHFIPKPKTTPLETMLKDLEREIHYSRSGVSVLIGAAFLIMAMLLQAALENAKYTPLSPTMRMEMKRAKDYLSDYHYLNDNRIKTTDELKTALSDTRDKIAALEAERQSIRNKIRRATPEEKLQLKEDAKAVTAKITPLRTHLKRLQRIYDQSDYVYKMIETEQKLERQVVRNRERSR